MKTWAKSENGGYKFEYDSDHALVSSFLGGDTTGYVNRVVVNEFESQFFKDNSYTKSTHLRRKINLGFSIGIGVVLGFIIISIVLTLIKAESFDSFWSIWALDIFNWNYILYLFLGFCIIVLICTTILSIKSFNKIKQIVSLVVALVFIAGGIGSGSYCYAKRVSEDTNIAIEMQEWIEHFDGLNSNQVIEEFNEWDNTYQHLLKTVRNRKINQTKWNSISSAYNVYYIIESIGVVTLEKKAEIDNAKNAYESLSVEEKSWIPNSANLIQASNRYDYLSHVTYTVRFNSNGGIGAMADIACKYGESFKLPKCDYSKYG